MALRFGLGAAQLVARAGEAPLPPAALVATFKALAKIHRDTERRDMS